VRCALDRNAPYVVDCASAFPDRLEPRERHLPRVEWCSHETSTPWMSSMTGDRTLSGASRCYRCWLIIRNAIRRGRSGQPTRYAETNCQRGWVDVSRTTGGNLRRALWLRQQRDMRSFRMLIQMAHVSCKEHSDADRMPVCMPESGVVRGIALCSGNDDRPGSAPPPSAPPTRPSDVNPRTSRVDTFTASATRIPRAASDRCQQRRVTIRVVFCEQIQRSAVGNGEPLACGADASSQPPATFSAIMRGYEHSQDTHWHGGRLEQSNK
jgi:hypothetical protein